MDKEMKGYLTLNEFVELLEAMAFDVKEKSNDYVRKESSLALKYLPNELTDMKTNIYRFRLFEWLYMERCAIY